MTTAHSTDGWTAAVRQRLSVGRLLPLGTAADGTWLAERAAASELRCVAARVPGAALGPLRLGLVDPDAAGAPAAPLPPSALPPGQLRIEGDFAAEPGEPLQAVAERLRGVLFDCAVDRLGLLVAEVDLRVTALLDRADAAEKSSAPTGPMEVEPAAPQGEAALAAAVVPGVACLTEALGSALVVAADHVSVELATAAGYRPLEVARVVRETVAASLPGAPPVAVLITAVGVTTRRR
ncbi:hypothetical protein [Streptomyces sp. NPDC051569]|uniref:hypothetical protein n=1 Tax=Streptomyces sp. NPDC051569 TaxID=3365661 RepID=UPI0037A53699